MESNEQTELTSKTETLIDGERITASVGGRIVGRGSEQKGKGLVDMDNRVMITGGRGYKGTK